MLIRLAGALVLATLFATPILSWRQSELFITTWGYGVPEPKPARYFPDHIELGCNVVMVQHTDSIGGARAHGLKALVYGAMPTLAESEAERAKVRELGLRWRGDRGLFGWLILDDAPQEQWEALGKVVACLRAVDPDHPIFCDFPYEPDPGMLSTYLGTVKPDVLSWDVYPLYEEGINHRYFRNWFYWLKNIREAAAAHSVPWWGFPQVFSWRNEGRHWAPNAAQVRFALYSMLTYGCRGVNWFALWDPQFFAIFEGPYRNFDYTLSQPTERHGAVKQLNAELRVLFPVLLKADCRAVYHAGAVPAGADPLQVNRWVAGCTGGNFALGIFQKPAGTTYLMVMNIEYPRNDSAPSSAVARLHLHGAVKARVLHKTTGSWSPLAVTREAGTTVCELRLLAGDAALLRIR